MDITTSLLEHGRTLRTAVVLSLNLRLTCSVDTLLAARQVSLAPVGVRIRRGRRSHPPVVSATDQSRPSGAPTRTPTG
jgi:hypothetical protein